MVYLLAAWSKAERHHLGPLCHVLVYSDSLNLSPLGRLKQRLQIIDYDFFEAVGTFEREKTGISKSAVHVLQYAISAKLMAAIL